MMEILQNHGLLFAAFMDIARKEFDGHFTIMAFTTNYRVAFGSIRPGIDCFEQDEIIREVQAFPTLAEAVNYACTYRKEWG